MKKGLKALKIALIILSFLVVAFSLTGNIVVSNKGSISLLLFESFYVYVALIIVAIIMILRNKNANGVIILSILTYLWTYYLVNRTINSITDITVTTSNFFYIYLSSAIFLILSLFINDSKLQEDNTITNNQETNNTNNNNFNEDKLLFTQFVSGLKGIPLATSMLLVNDIPSNSFNLIYCITPEKTESKTIKLPIDSIRNISYESKIRMNNFSKKVEDNETKSILLSTVVFGGNPAMLLLGKEGFNSLFNSISNNYDKIDYSAYYEITIDTLINGIETKLVLTSEKNPEQFINQINNLNKEK